MPLGGLLPYGDDNVRDMMYRPSSDPMADIRAQLGMGMPDEGQRGSVDGSGLPSMAAPKAGFDLAALLPQLLAAFSAGSAIRQKRPDVLMDIVGQFMQQKELTARGRRADEAASLRAEREQRLAEDADRRLDAQEGRDKARGEREEESFKRSQGNDLQNLINQIEDNARQTFTTTRPEGAAAEAYVQGQSERVAGMPGGDPMKVKEMLLSLLTMVGNQQPEQVPLITLEPGKPGPATVPKGAVVRNAPQPRQPREAPVPRAYNTTEEDGTIYRVTEDPRTGRVISREKVGKRPKPAGSNDALDRILAEAGSGGSAGNTKPSAPPAPAQAAGPKVGATVTVKGKKIKVTKVYPDGTFDGDVVK